MTAQLLLLASAGALGALARHGLSLAVRACLPQALFPAGTLAVNLTGCLLFGLVWALGVDRGLIRPEWRDILLVGFLGAFTTFSTFIFESDRLLQDGSPIACVLYAGGHLLLGLLALRLGMAAARC